MTRPKAARLRAAFALLGATPRVRFARVRALLWVAVGVVSFPLGWAQSVVLVWIASVYANVASEIASGEAADDKAVIDRLDRIHRAVSRTPGPRGLRHRAARPPQLRRSKLLRTGYPGQAGTSAGRAPGHAVTADRRL